ncbi:hypothetical protein Pst134EA_011206 [Puccinia striiformis f. sp. tritici]|uniref:hypothetical protein n=1 Tax=Puccinia striiformis f. sp. tritici TaxID=168172 RepID=UPI00200807D4|nr:hypothetical protein Pst134EA_011206 [Puccinia striiformis f. sp. tritici]KAH9467567.1 hypothetical protein Pst134EA_011206 [Puccinia striiformis f. sp. tritici]KAI9604817.1 hypothetical protein H4Q26_002787 [Puccinia striiformis f. sp. tritici PST-130]
MASSLQALSNAMKNATTREQPARNIEDLEEEEEESEKEGNVLTSTGNTKGAPTLTATGTSSNGDSNVGGLRRSTRAALKTLANPNISKGATVPTPDLTEHTHFHADKLGLKQKKKWAKQSDNQIKNNRAPKYSKKKKSVNHWEHFMGLWNQVTYLKTPDIYEEQLSILRDHLKTC